MDARHGAKSARRMVHMPRDESGPAAIYPYRVTVLEPLTLTRWDLGYFSFYVFAICAAKLHTWRSKVPCMCVVMERKGRDEADECDDPACDCAAKRTTKTRVEDLYPEKH